jgi:hypothetical protein
MERKPKQNYRGHSSARGPQGVNTSGSGQGSAVKAESPLHLGFLPGTEGAGRVAATERSGNSIVVSGSSYYGEAVADPTVLTQPAVAKIVWDPMLTALASDEDKSIVTTAMFRYYNAIRAKNASVSAFSPIDVFFSLEAVTGLTTLLSAIRLRLQVLCTAGSQINGAFPQQLMAALGLSASDRDNLSARIALYNQCVALSKGLIMPKSFKLFARQARLAGTVFLDDPSVDKSQLIVMEPSTVFEWDLDPTSPTVGKLIRTTVSGDSLISLLHYAMTLINMYTLDQDMNNIYAEIRKAFDSNEVYQLQEFPLDGEGISLEFEQVLLDQIKNANPIGDWAQGSDGPVLQENTVTGSIEYDRDLDIYPLLDNISDLVFDNTSSGAMVAHGRERPILVYTHDNQPGESAVADLTAFKTYWTTSENGVTLRTCGTEVIKFIQLYWKDPVYPHVVSVFKYYPMNMGEPDLSGGYTPTNWQSYCFGSRAYRNFSYLPVVEVMWGVANDVKISDVLEGDIDNRFTITPDALALIHRSVAAYLITM